MKLRRLKKKLRRQALRQRALGKLNVHEFDACMTVSRNPEMLAKLNDNIESMKRLSKGDGSWQDWFANAWDWFVNNWDEILRIILTIVPLLLEPKPDVDS